MAKFFKLLILVPIGALVVAFAIANRQTVSISLDPFAAPDPTTAFMAGPLWAILFVALGVGVIVGGIATWFTQGTNRRRARRAEDEAERWREEVRRISEQPPIVATAHGRGLARVD